MNEYNKRTLQNVLDDVREENDTQWLKEIEEAQNNPLFAVTEDEAAAFADKYAKPEKKKNPYKMIMKIAAVIVVLAISSTLIPFNVEGKKSNLIELVINYIDSESIGIGADTEDMLLKHTGEFVPGWIPDGYTVDSVSERSLEKIIIFASKNDGYIFYNETDLNSNLSITNNDNNSNMVKMKILGYDAMYLNNDTTNDIIIITEHTYILINSTDKNVDLIKFAENLKKR